VTATYTLSATGTVTRLPCRPVAVRGSAGVVWHSCTCRPRIRVADPARVLHAGQAPAGPVLTTTAAGTEVGR
jgi:hypothetical protein